MFPQDGIVMKTSILSRLCLSTTPFGEERSDQIYLKKYRKSCFRSPRKGVPFTLHPKIEYFNMLVMYVLKHSLPSITQSGY